MSCGCDQCMGPAKVPAEPSISVKTKNGYYCLCGHLDADHFTDTKVCMICTCREYKEPANGPSEPSISKGEPQAARVLVATGRCDNCSTTIIANPDDYMARVFGCSCGGTIRVRFYVSVTAETAREIMEAVNVP